MHGLPNSWGSSIAATRFPSEISTIKWSPCNRLIAVACGTSIVREGMGILDAVTLARLTTLEFPLGRLDMTLKVIFSPDAHLLTWYGGDPQKLVTWDLQTGVLVSVISLKHKRDYDGYSSVAYSMCGTMLGVLVACGGNLVISTYNILSGTCIYSHSAHSVEGKPLEMWTQGERLRFATLKSTSVTIWEVGFTSMHAQIEVETLPTPDDCHPRNYLFHPTPPRLAFTTGRQVLIWDLQGSKFLLDTRPISQEMAFSLDGQFFAAGREWDSKIRLWKESPTGYILHREFSPDTEAFCPLISPNGELIIAFGTSAIQLWHTTDSTTSLSVTSTGNKKMDDFVLTFSPDKVLAAVARMGDETVTVLDLRSGTPRLIINTEMEVYALGVAGRTVVVVGDEKIITWNLPGEDAARNTGANVNDSTRITTFVNDQDEVAFTSMSPDLQRVVIIESAPPDLRYRSRDDTTEPGSSDLLHLYNVSTGKWLGTASAHFAENPWFTPDGCEVWCDVEDGEVDGWKIIEDSESDVVDSESDVADSGYTGSESSDVCYRKSNVVRLERLGPGVSPPDGFPWRPHHGYELTDDGWILGSNDKRLLWLPPHWRPYGERRMWCGRFFALLHGELPEAVILELE